VLVTVRRPGDARLQQILAEQHDAPLTYTEIGASLTADLPAGYHHDAHTETVGHGDADYARAVLGLRAWEAHRAAGATIFPAGAPIETGVDVVLVLRAAVVHVVAACRIVAVVDEAARFGFAYGTLGIHPECGEEAFVVEQTPAGDVVFRVTAFSRPRDLLARLGAPVASLVQRRTTSAYVDGIRRFVHDGRS
jgi:uncharacterized protein (UPF0548 family)